MKVKIFNGIDSPSLETKINAFLNQIVHDEGNIIKFVTHAETGSTEETESATIITIWYEDKERSD